MSPLSRGRMAYSRERTQSKKTKEEGKMKRPIMNRNIASGWLVIVFAATFVVSMAAPAQAAGSACSLARAAGTYAFSTSGTVVGVGPRVSAGILTLDAAGNLTNGKATSSFNGAIAGETFSGTYVKQFRGFFTSATLPDGTSLLTVISADGSKMVRGTMPPSAAGRLSGIGTL